MLFRRETPPGKKSPAQESLLPGADGSLRAIQAARGLAAIEDEVDLLAAAVERVIPLVPLASRGYVILLQGNAPRFGPLIGYGTELKGVEAGFGPWRDPGPRVITNIVAELFQAASEQRKALYAQLGMRGITSCVIAPLRSRQGDLGSIVLDSYAKEPLRDTDAQILGQWARLAADTLLALKVRRYMREGLWEFVRAVVQGLEARDFARLGHGERVTVFALAVGRRMQLTPDELETLWFASMLHDLGKGLGATDDLAPRDGPDDHPALAANLLSTVSYLSEVVPVIRHHHEHYDGTGQPDGLTGDQIPFLARVLAVANAYDHLSTDRGENLRPKEAVRRLQAESGRRFDPGAVQAMVEVIQSGLRTAELRGEASRSNLFPL